MAYLIIPIQIDILGYCLLIPLYNKRVSVTIDPLTIRSASPCARPPHPALRSPRGEVEVHHVQWHSHGVASRAWDPGTNPVLPSFLLEVGLLEPDVFKEIGFKISRMNVE